MNLKLYFLLITFGNITSALINLNNDNKTQKLNQHARKIYLEECKKCKTALIIHCDEDENVDSFLKTISYDMTGMLIFTIKLENYTTNQIGPALRYKPDLTIIFTTEKSNSIPAVIFGIELLPFWNNRGKFLVVYSAEVEDVEAWLKETFEEFWARQAPQVVVAFYQDGVRVFSYNPYTKEYGIEVSEGSELPKLYTHGITNMHGYPIKMYFFDTVIKMAVVEEVVKGKIKYNGIAGKYFETLKDAYNSSIEIHRLSQDFDEATINNADTNMPLADFIDMFRELYDFDMIMCPMRMYSDNDLDKVFLYERSDMIVLVPRGELIPRYLYIFLIVPSNVWLAVFTSFLALTFTTGVIKIISGFKPEFLNVLNDNLRLLLNTAASQRERNVKEKLLMVLWMFHCLIFLTLFQSNMTSSLIVPKYYPDIESLEDLYKTDIKVYGGNYSLDQVLKGMSVHDVDKFRKHTVAVPRNVTTIGDNLDWIRGYRDHGVIITQEQVYQLQASDKSTGRTTYNVIKDSPMPIAYGFSMPRDKIYFKELKTVCGRIQDAGINLYWKRYNYGLDLRNESYGTKVLKEFSSGNQVLGLEHLQSAFMLLIFGLFMASVVLCIELLYKIMCTCKKKNANEKMLPAAYQNIKLMDIDKTLAALQLEKLNTNKW